MRRLVAPLLVALVALLATGCGEKAEPEEPQPGEDPVELPVDGDTVVLQSFTGGGYVPPIEARRSFPEVVLYADGRLLTASAGAGDTALPALTERRIAEGQTEGIVSAAVNAGLGEENDYGDPDVTDLPTTTVVLETADWSRENSVYALGYDEDAGLTSEQVELRGQLSELLDSLTDPASNLGTDLPDPVPFTPDAYVVSSIELGGATAPGGSAIRWPLEPDRFASGKHPDVCTVVEGDDALKLARAARGATADAVWESGDARAEVAIRPAIGLEDRCPDDGSSYVGTGG